MKRQLWLTAAVLLAVTVAAVVVVSREVTAGPSTVSREADGWLAARRYLEARGAEVTLLDRPPPAETSGVLVTAFPWHLERSLPAAGAVALAGDAALRNLVRFAGDGGTLVIGYHDPQPGETEDDLLERLGIGYLGVRGEPPLSPLAWRRHVRARWTLRPEADHLASVAEPPAPVGIPAHDGMPVPPPGATVLYRAEVGDLPPPPAGTGEPDGGAAEEPGEPAGSNERRWWREAGGVPAVFTFRHGEGRVVLLPAAALSNGELAGAGNADLLESLYTWLGPRWTFDEYHHGLVGKGTAAGESLPSLGLDLFAAHLALLYLLTVLALVRRFGPPWREPPARSGSAATFLRGLGALHHRLGHHAAAGEWLVARVRELDPRLELPPALAARTAAPDGEALVALARDLAELRRRSRGGRSGPGTGAPAEERSRRQDDDAATRRGAR